MSKLHLGDCEHDYEIGATCARSSGATVLAVTTMHALLAHVFLAAGGARLAGGPSQRARRAYWLVGACREGSL